MRAYCWSKTLLSLVPLLYCCKLPLKLKDACHTFCGLQVALVCGLDDAAKKDLLRGLAHGGAHLNKLLKFVTVRREKGSKRSGITLLGGPVDPAVDDGVPG